MFFAAQLKNSPTKTLIFLLMKFHNIAFTNATNATISTATFHHQTEKITKHSVIGLTGAISKESDIICIPKEL